MRIHWVTNPDDNSRRRSLRWTARHYWEQGWTWFKHYWND